MDIPVQLEMKEGLVPTEDVVKEVLVPEDDVVEEVLKMREGAPIGLKEEVKDVDNDKQVEKKVTRVRMLQDVLREPLKEERPAARRKGKGRRRLDIPAKGRISNFFTKIICTKGETGVETIENGKGAQRKRKLEDDGGLELMIALETNLTKTKTIDGNPPEGVNEWGDTNSFLETESSTERKTTEGVKKGANWGIFKGIIGDKVNKTPWGFRGKKRRE